MAAKFYSYRLIYWHGADLRAPILQASLCNLENKIRKSRINDNGRDTHKSTAVRTPVRTPVFIRINESRVSAMKCYALIEKQSTLWNNSYIILIIILLYHINYDTANNSNIYKLISNSSDNINYCNKQLVSNYG